MKRVLFLLVAALALSLVAATPALAQEPPQAVIYADGVFTDDLVPVPIDVGPEAGQQIPDTYTFSVFVGVFAANRGLALTARQYSDTSVAVLLLNGSNGSLYREITSAEARRYWTGVLNPIDWATPFNPKMGTGVWAQAWFGPLGVLPVGHYDVTLTSTLRHTTTDLIGYEDGQRSPIMFKPGGPFGTFSYTTSFDVVD